MTIEKIKLRNEIIKTLRDFFEMRDYLEIETPLLSSSLIPEPSLEVFETEFIHPFKDSYKAYLIPSPEVWLKKFLSKNHINIFEISKCFRNSEQFGWQHNSEFTMIEYYTMDYTHMDSLKLTMELLDYINDNLPYSKLPQEHLIMTMEDAFRQYAGFSLRENYSLERLKIQAEDLGVPTAVDDDWEVTFNRIFIDKVEPYFPKDKNVFLTDFPSKIKTLAKNISGTPWAQRWELYIQGIECGNCYSEERDFDKIKEYYKTERDVKHKVDDNYPDLFKTFPECSGGAIGVDRLIMGVLGSEKINDVILFPVEEV